jgi:ubiquinone/menaquinone biosynthesis C-methylase UbiE
MQECFIPTQGLELEPYVEAQDLCAVHHIIRYQWARAVLNSSGFSSLLDVACGAGFGSYLLAQAMPGAEVIGVDYDSDAVEYAKSSYSLSNLIFKLGTAADLGAVVGDQQFDCIVSFDTIEHVMHREIMMEGLVNHLKPTGMFLLSTPCAWMQNKLNPDWEHHKIEYSPESLFAFVRRYFASVLRPEDDTFPERDVFKRLIGSGVRYPLIANPLVCLDPIRINNPYRT